MNPALALLLAFAIYGAFLALVWACCIVAGRADDRAEQMLREVSDRDGAAQAGVFHARSTNPHQECDHG